MERHANDLVNKPIITFDTGRRLAQVEDLLLDPERNQVLALLIDGGGLFTSPKVIPFGHIQAIGERAVLIPNRSVVYEVRRIPELKRLFDDRMVCGMRVYSETGDRLGTVSDMVINDQTGEVLAYEVSGGALGDMMQGKRTIIPREILRMGAQVLYVPTATAARLEQAQGGMRAAVAQAQDGMRAAVAQAQDGMRAAVAQARQKSTSEQMGESFVQFRQDARGFWDQLMHHTNRITDQTESKIEQQRIDRALGRPAARVILDRQDNVILNTGDIITNAAVEQARAAGVLGILLDSVYMEAPKLSLEDLKAPWAGRASLEEQSTPPARTVDGPAPILSAGRRIASSRAPGSDLTAH